MSLARARRHDISNSGDLLLASKRLVKVCLDLRFLQRACVNSQSGGWGGVGIYSANLWKALARREGRTITMSPLLIRRHQTRDFRSVVGSSAGIHRVNSPLMGRLPLRLWLGKYFSFLQLIESEVLLARILKRRRFDVVHMLDQTLPPPGRFGKVVTLHDIPFTKGTGTKFQRFYLHRVVDRADRLVCVSSATAEELLAFAPATANKISVCPAGLDLKVFRRGPRQPEQLASRFQLSAPFFLHVGVCAGRKNPDGILAAVKIVISKWDGGFEMVFVGPYQVDEPALAYLRARGSQLGISGNLRFLGDVTTEELVQLYRSSMALVFPSLMEGFGYPPVEALACGTPCIISEEGAVAEIVGDVGLRVNPRSADQIADAMMAVLRGEAPDVRDSGAALAARFGASSMADHLVGIYEDVRRAS